jgi:hypothetical protein
VSTAPARAFVSLEDRIAARAGWLRRRPGARSTPVTGRHLAGSRDSRLVQLEVDSYEASVAVRILVAQQHTEVAKQLYRELHRGGALTPVLREPLRHTFTSDAKYSGPSAYAAIAAWPTRWVLGIEDGARPVGVAV